ncbi:hypothetical protein DUI87_09085 [Hirundo rustica rustica]|uniref:Uncharacterized protein n=1 Tax=Hirundo rustica rustica TaxID=333673 RepID=A0A3M0KN06_HIRRU|nr:hypothetical protein DUI87_09085 [Hirundo rustica rustica]
MGPAVHNASCPPGSLPLQPCADDCRKTPEGTEPEKLSDTHNPRGSPELLFSFTRLQDNDSAERVEKKLAQGTEMSYDNWTFTGISSNDHGGESIKVNILNVSILIHAALAQMNTYVSSCFFRVSRKGKEDQLVVIALNRTAVHSDKSSVSVHIRKDLVTQKEHPQKHAVVQVSGSRECQSLVLLPEGSRDNTNNNMRCHQANDLLILLVELRDEVEQLRSTGDSEEEIERWNQSPQSSQLMKKEE